MPHSVDSRVPVLRRGDEARAIMRTAAARREPFDVAIIDGHMPGMDGFELR